MLVSVNEEIHHITYRYSQTNDIEFAASDFAKLIDIFDKRTVSGQIIQLGEIIVCMPDQSIHTDGSTHITIDSGNHAPRDMKSLALAIKNKQPKLNLIDKKTKTIEYDMTKAIVTPCKIDIVDAFGVAY